MPLSLIAGFSFPALIMGLIMIFNAWSWGEMMNLNSQIFLVWQLSSWGSWSWQFPILLDFFSFFFSSIVFFISFFVFLFAGTYMQEEFFYKRFGYLVWFFLFSMQALIFIPHLFFLLIGWDGLGLTSFLLVIYYNSAKSLSSGLLTLAYNRLGDVFFLLLVSFLLKEGTWMPFFSGSLSSNMIWVSILIVMAAMTKSAQVPFSAWLPAAMAAPTPVSALVHSSTLVTAGVFLSIRFHEMIFSQWWVSNSIFLISSLTTLLAGLCALKEFDMKKIIALSTLSNLGMMMSICSLGYVDLAFFHLVVHALFKALLFISAGYLIDVCHHSQDLRFMGDIYSRFPLISISFLVANAALCGLPFMAGFYSKDLLLESGFFFVSSYVTLGIYYGGLFLTFLYSWRVISMCLFSTSSFSPLSPQNQTHMMFFIPLSLLSLLSVILGAFLFSYLSELQSEVILDLSSKKMITGAIFLFVLQLAGKIMKFFQPDRFSFFSYSFSTLFFLSIISGQLILPTLMRSGKNIFTQVDNGWKELLFPKFFLFLFKEGTKKMSWLTLSSGFIITFSFVSLIFSLYY